MSNTLRCPYCLFVMSLPEAYSPEAEFSCVGCRQNFHFKDALPGVIEAGDSEPESAEAPPPPKSFNTLWLIALALAALGSIVVLAAGNSLKGPDFLKYFGGLGIVLLVTQFAVRHGYHDTVAISVMAFIIFEAVGLTRFIAGYLVYDMRNFTFLFLIMGGGLLYFVRSEQLDSVRNRSGCSSGCSSCSSCGGGCGGCGGGCGGCGN